MIFARPLELKDSFDAYSVYIQSVSKTRLYAHQFKRKMNIHFTKSLYLQVDYKHLNTVNYDYQHQT